MDLNQRYPAIADLKASARARIPLFVWEYLDSATGTEATLRRNRAKLDEVLFRPSILHGEFTPDLTTELFGQRFPLPFGVSPVGMSGLIWPDAERLLAAAAGKAGLPYSISTVASQTPEFVAPVLGQHGWFQMYPPRDPEIRRDMLKRAKDAGFSALILTVDVPVASRRERQTRSGLTQPPKLTPRLFAQVAMRPAWALGTLRMGMPRMRLMDDYAENKVSLSSTAHIGYLLRTSPDWDYLMALRDAWDGPLIIKGALDPDDAARLQDAGADAIWVSNHAGRQFDAAPATIEVLPAIRAATTLPVIFDSGIEGGLDILRAIALGADFVMLGRAWHYALGALGPDGPAHLIDMLTKDMTANMGQLGARRLSDLPGRALPGP
ncbi:alpha-hydroxy acid oxidase [Defluviimonas sp. SAOS-178_SWC]|uniref:alpha-hydroxy acid oxidase n=1 Tax=Defluviimonas sp. SAOS-178_SWC TaxID=3121287 RepID=UPI003221F028